MYGSIIGDIVGSPYELDKGNKTKDFPFFSENSHFTDDSIMTVAVAQGLMEAGVKASSSEISSCVQNTMREWGLRYPDAGYGSRFKKWLKSKKPTPYESSGNGSAMRVSAVGWLYGTIEQVREAARATAMPTHNHPEGIKGAEAVASAIYLARTGSSKEAIKNYITENFGYDLSRTCDEIRPGYHHSSSCQDSVPEAITAFLEGSDFEDVIRTAVSLGGDTDTIAAIAGSIAEAFYGIPAYLIEEAKKRIPQEMIDVLNRFNVLIKDSQANSSLKQDGLDHNDLISEAIAIYNTNKEKEAESPLIAVLDAIRFQKSRGKCFLAPIEIGKLPDEIPEDVSVGDILKAKDGLAEKICSVTDDDGKKWYLLFTDKEHLKQWKNCPSHPFTIEGMLEFASKEETYEGFIINMNNGDFKLSKDLINAISKAETTTVWNVINPADDTVLIKKEILRLYSTKSELFEGNEDLVKAMRLVEKEPEDAVNEFLFMICRQMHAGRYFIVPVKDDVNPNSIQFTRSGKINISPAQLRSFMQEIPLCDDEGNDVTVVGAFTDIGQFCMGQVSKTLDIPIITLLECVKKWDKGEILTLNPWDVKPFAIDCETASKILECYEHVKGDLNHLDGEQLELYAEDDNDGPELQLVMGDITQTAGVDAIVNAADNALSPLAEGVNKAIHSAAGQQLEKECRKLGGCETGNTKITKAYKLPFKYIIHTAVPVWYGGRSGETKFLEACYSSCIIEASNKGIRRIALPPLLSPNSSFPVSKAAKIAAETLASMLYISGFSRDFDLIRLVFEDEKTMKVYIKAFDKLFKSND